MHHGADDDLARWLGSVGCRVHRRDRCLVAVKTRPSDWVYSGDDFGLEVELLTDGFGQNHAPGPVDGSDYGQIVVRIPFLRRGRSAPCVRKPAVGAGRSSASDDPTM